MATKARKSKHSSNSVNWDDVPVGITKEIDVKMAPPKPKVDIDDDAGMTIPGLGEKKPTSRPLSYSFFGYVPDAYSERTPMMPSEGIKRVPHHLTGKEEKNGSPDEGCDIDVEEDDAMSEDSIVSFI
jgi:hypothetical protein